LLPAPVIGLGLFAGLLLSLPSHATEANRPASIFLSTLPSSWLSAQNSAATLGTFSTFFESGRLPWQDRFQLEPPPDVQSAIEANAKSWQPMQFEQSECTFWLPLGLISSKTVDLDSALGAIEFQTTSVDTDQGRYLIAESDPLSQTFLQQPLKIWEAMKKRVVALDTTGALPASVSEDIIRLQGVYPGREFTWQGSTTTVRLRAYLIDSRVYVLGVHYPTDQAPTKQIEAFFNSFKVQTQS
jgi:hypothetical protein